MKGQIQGQKEVAVAGQAIVAAIRFSDETLARTHVCGQLWRQNFQEKTGHRVFGGALLSEKTVDARPLVPKEFVGNDFLSGRESAFLTKRDGKSFNNRPCANDTRKEVVAEWRGTTLVMLAEDFQKKGNDGEVAICLGTSAKANQTLRELRDSLRQKTGIISADEDLSLVQELNNRGLAISNGGPTIKFSSIQTFLDAREHLAPIIRKIAPGMAIY